MLQTVKDFGNFVIDQDYSTPLHTAGLAGALVMGYSFSLLSKVTPLHAAVFVFSFLKVADVADSILSNYTSLSPAPKNLIKYGVGFIAATALSIGLVKAGIAVNAVSVVSACLLSALALAVTKIAVQFLHKNEEFGSIDLFMLGKPFDCFVSFSLQVLPLLQ